ncbi:unnamed protein product [Ceutorhynchus assimilis]|uniref:Uncharacterized protein n=1 Tax=Ceutorhynchus assimilis TaxID=467358 RepID=A0A9N9MNK9_9CUCU|nr:unnamed protein product [Ceutorhynchus assimilis]
MPQPPAPPPGAFPSSHVTPVVTSSGPSSVHSTTPSVTSSPLHHVHQPPPIVTVSAASPSGASGTQISRPSSPGDSRPSSPAHTFTFTIIMKKVTPIDEFDVAL